MKKLSVLIALALCFTIGGAYAAWSYASGNVATQDVTGTIGIQMGAVENKGAAGTLAASSTVKLVVEPVDGTYVPTVEPAASDAGSIVVTFTADPNASADVLKNGIAVYIEFTVTSTGDQVITAIAPITIAAGSWDHVEGSLTFTKTITAEQIANSITLINTTLPTIDAYNKFNTNLGKTTITAQVIAGAPAGI